MVLKLDSVSREPYRGVGIEERRLARAAVSLEREKNSEGRRTEI